MAFFNPTPESKRRSRLRAGEATSRCKIEQFDGTLDSSGQPDDKNDANWDTVSGMESIACSDWSPQGAEIRGGSLTATRVDRVAVLLGRYVITPNTMRATITRYGVTTGVYDILDSPNYGLAGKPKPSEGLETKLTLERITT